METSFASGGKGLKVGAIGLLESIVIGMAATAPAYTMAATLGYWGWDSAVSVNEETRARRHNPGLAVVIAMALLLGTFLLTTVAAMAYAGAGDQGLGLANEDTAVDILATVGTAVLGVVAMLAWNAVRPEYFRSRLPAAEVTDEPGVEPPPLAEGRPAAI